MIQTDIDKGPSIQNMKTKHFQKISAQNVSSFLYSRCLTPNDKDAGAQHTAQNLNKQFENLFVANDNKKINKIIHQNIWKPTFTNM